MAERRVLVDAGPIVAVLSTRDEHHGACKEAMAGLPVPLLTCWPVLTEAAWLLRRSPAAVDGLFRGFEAGVFAMLDLDAGALPRIAGFLRRDESIGAQVADAALVYLAEREGIGTVFTLDRRDFAVYRLRRGRALKLVP